MGCTKMRFFGYSTADNGNLAQTLSRSGTLSLHFDYMPELHWTFGYPLALALMVSISVGLYAVFRHVRWL